MRCACPAPHLSFWNERQGGASCRVIFVMFQTSVFRGSAQSKALGKRTFYQQVCCLTSCYNRISVSIKAPPQLPLSLADAYSLSTLSCACVVSRHCDNMTQVRPSWPTRSCRLPRRKAYKRFCTSGRLISAANNRGWPRRLRLKKQVYIVKFTRPRTLRVANRMKSGHPGPLLHSKH